jgi:hypothetical protein
LPFDLKLNQLVTLPVAVEHSLVYQSCNFFILATQQGNRLTPNSHLTTSPPGTDHSKPSGLMFRQSGHHRIMEAPKNPRNDGFRCGNEDVNLDLHIGINSFTVWNGDS